MAPIRIRAAVVGDGTALGALHVHAWQRAFAEVFDPVDLAALDPVARGRSWDERLAVPAAERPASTSVAVLEQARGPIVGFVTYGPARSDHDSTPRPDDGEVWAIYADPDHLGQGVGAALMHHALRALTDAGHPDAVLWTPRDNLAGRAFYDRGGWLTDGAEHLYTFGSREVVEVRYRISLRPDRRAGTGR